MPDLKDVAPVGTWMLILVGWAVVNHQQAVRETDKAAREAIDAIIGDIEKIARDLRKYYCLARNLQQEQALIYSISRLAARLREIEALLDEDFSYDWAPKVAGFRQAATMHIGPEHTLALAADDQIIAAIFVASDDLTDCLRGKKARSFVKRWRLFEFLFGTPIWRSKADR